MSNHTTLLRRVLASACAVAACGAVGAQCGAVAITAISPPSAEHADGNSSLSPPAIPGRLQLLFPADDFTALPDTHRRIRAFNFRLDASQLDSVAWTFPNLQLSFSTTDKSSLTTVFEDNHGPNRTVVHTGELQFQLLGTGPQDGPRDIAVGMRLDAPFDYDPAQGNLLMDWMILEATLPVPSPPLDVEETGLTQNVLLGALDSPTGDLLPTRPSVTQFEFVPEPSSLALMGMGLACVGLGYGRTCRSRTLRELAVKQHV